jgi:hypothetical protein
VKEVFDSPGLISDLSTFSHKQQGEACPSQYPSSHQSALFLKIEAAADFYSSNRTRMQNPPPVLVDIILDPFLFNIVPQSLVSTGAYIIVISLLAFFLSTPIWQWLRSQSISKTKPS